MQYKHRRKIVRFFLFFFFQFGVNFLHCFFASCWKKDYSTTLAEMVKKESVMLLRLSKLISSTELLGQKFQAQFLLQFLRDWSGIEIIERQ